MLNAFSKKSLQMYYNAHVSAHRAWWGSATATAFTMVGMLIQTALDRQVVGVPIWPALLGMGVSSVLFFLLLAGRHRTSANLAVWAFLINAATVTFVLVFVNEAYAQLDRLAIPFEPNKLGCLIVGFLAPSFFAGTATIVMLAGSSMLQFLMFSPALQQKIAFGEPYAVLAFAFGGFAALVYRLRMLALNQEFERLKAEAAAVRHFATVFLRVRDLMNTPLQVLEFSAAHLKGTNAQKDLAFESIERALQHLNDLNVVLKQYEDKIEWTPEDITPTSRL